MCMTSVGSCPQIPIYRCPMIVIRATSLSGLTQLVALNRYCMYWALLICQQNTLTTTCSPHVRTILWLSCSFLLTMFAPTFFRKRTNFPPSSRILLSITGLRSSESKKKTPLLFLSRAVQCRCTPPPKRVLSNTQQTLCPLGRNRSNVYSPLTLSRSTYPAFNPSLFPPRWSRMRLISRKSNACDSSQRSSCLSVRNRTIYFRRWFFDLQRKPRWNSSMPIRRISSSWHSANTMTRKSWFGPVYRCAATSHSGMGGTVLSVVRVSVWHPVLHRGGSTIRYFPPSGSWVVP